MPELCLLVVCTERLQTDYLPPATDCVMAGHQHDKHHTGHVKNKMTDPHIPLSSIISSFCVHRGTKLPVIQLQKEENTALGRARRGE